VGQIDINSINGIDNRDVGQRTQTDFARQQKQDREQRDCG